MIVPKVFSIKLWTLTKNRLVLASSGPLERWDLRITQLGSGTWDNSSMVIALWSLLVLMLQSCLSWLQCVKIQQLAKMVPIPNLYFSVELKVTKHSGKYWNITHNIASHFYIVLHHHHHHQQNWSSSHWKANCFW